MKPQFKKSFTSLIENNESILLFFEDDCLEIQDPDKEFKLLIDQLTGTQSIEEIANKLNSSTEVILDVILDLNEYGLIEDFIHNEETDLTDKERERYRSNLNYFSNFSNLKVSRYSYQEKLKDSKVTVLGLGGSSIILSCLAGMGIGSIVGLDFDEIELSNLNRQFLYNENDVGNLKTAAAKTALSKMNSDININVYNQKITSAAELSMIIENSDIIINSIDQPSILSTRWVNFAAVKHNIPILQGGTGSKKLLLQRFMPNKGGCFDCYLIQILKENPDFEQELRYMYGEILEGRNTAFAPNVAFLAGLISNETANILCNFNNNTEESSVTTEYNSITMKETASKEWVKLNICPTCGNTEKNSEPVDLDTLIFIANKQKQGLKI
ncbi:HesA/MoeB/ThiF family protein [Bacillus sp. AK031]